VKDHLEIIQILSILSQDYLEYQNQKEKTIIQNLHSKYKNQLKKNPTQFLPPVDFFP